MKKTLASCFVALCLGFGAVAYAQNQNAPSQPSPQAQQKVTLTGCLAKGSDANQYTITDQDSHQKVMFPGPAQLDRYVNQVVKLTGSMMVRDNGDKVFRPETVASVASSCAA